MRYGRPGKVDWVRAPVGRFGRDRRGGVALVFGLSATILAALVGGGIDYARLTSRRSQLQAAVDAGALAGGNALKLAASSIDSVRGATEQAVRDAAKPVADRPFTLYIEVPAEKTSVFARAEETVSLGFGALVGVGSATIAAQARVDVVGRMRLCMLTLDPYAPGAFYLESEAKVTARNCSLYSDSTSKSGMVGGNSAMARADTICSAGGYSGSRANFAPPPQTGCPVIEDPLKDRPSPNVEGSCTHLPYPYGMHKNGLPRPYNVVFDNARIDLDPGVYCSGLTIKDRAVVHMKPGIYVFRDGPLTVTEHATLTGNDVGLFFTGNRGGLLFNKQTTISLTAPTSGLMAGLLISEERTVHAPIDAALGLLDSLGLPLTPTPAPIGATKPMRIYRIISNNARTMLGTIYLPSGRLVIDADKPVADQSAYTVVVAQQVNLYKGPNLVLNADYDRTSVPVPKGVGPVSGKLMLTQ